MITRRKILCWLLFLITCSHGNAEDIEQKDDLVQSESKDPSNIEIIKQIKRLNEDGSYTFGYEAEDGTFKIESRDVLGNIKGTFGYVDEDGEIKRVSYSTSNTTEQSNVSTEKIKSSVIQQIPRSNRTNSTTRRPTLIYPHVTSTPSSTVIQSIPRRRILISSNSTTTTEKPSFKTMKSVDFDSKTTTESSVRYNRPSVNYVRSTTSSNAEGQRYTEGQILRPTQPDNVTPRPTEQSYVHRVYVTRAPLTSDHISSTIKPIAEVFSEESSGARSNLLRRQLSQEKITNFDPRAHVLNIQQSLGDDTSDVYGNSFTTGTPRPLFTTTNKSKFVTLSAPTTVKSITKPAETFQQRHQQNDLVQETTTDSTITENNYITPNPLPFGHYQGRDIRPRDPYYRGPIFIPINPHQQGRYVFEEVNEQKEPHYPHYVINDQYQREHPRYVQDIQEVQQNPVPIVYQRRPVVQTFNDNEYPGQHVQYVHRRPIPTNLAQFQDEIDNIKPPVSTTDFQKLLNRLIIRQRHLKEINRLEQARYVQDPYYQERIVQPTPVSLFVRTAQDPRQNNGPIQFVPQAQNPRIFVQSNQKTLNGQFMPDKYNSDYRQTPVYRAGRKASRVVDNAREHSEITEYLPPDVREMLLLRMLQLAINPNLPLPPVEEDSNALPTHRKEAVRNVEILGEEPDDPKPSHRNKRYEKMYDEY